MGKLVRYQPPQLGPGWQPVGHGQPPQQAARSVILGKVVREAVIFGALALVAGRLGVLGLPSGWLTLPIARGLLGLLRNCWADGGARQVGRTLTAAAAVAALAVIVVAGPTVPRTTPTFKPPVQVDAAQTEQLDKAKNVWAQVWEQAAKGWANHGKTLPGSHKEGK